MKNFITIFIAFLTFLFLNISSIAAPKAGNNGFLKVAGDKFELNGKPFTMKGFNYMPSGYGWTPINLWDWKEVDKELALGRSLGANTVRIHIGFYGSTGNIKKKKVLIPILYHPTKETITAIKQFLDLAQKHNFKVIITLFGHFPKELIWQNDHTTTDKYLAELIPNFVNDTRIAAWDIRNEGDSNIKQGSEQFTNAINWHSAISQQIKSIDSNHLITAGFVNIANAKYSQDFVDFVCFHYYHNTQTLAKLIRDLKSELHPAKPIVEEEFGAPSSGGENNDMAKHILWLGFNLDTSLNMEKIGGAIFWQLMDMNPTPTALNFITPIEKELAYGVFDGNGNPKPSTFVAKMYFTGNYDINKRITFKYDDVMIHPHHPSLTIGAGFESMQFLDNNHSVIQTIKFGTVEAVKHEGQGWYPKLNWDGQWAGSSDGVSNLYHFIPENAAYIKIRAKSLLGTNRVQVYCRGKYLGIITVTPQLTDYILPLK